MVVSVFVEHNCNIKKQDMKTNKPNLKTDKNKTLYSIKSNAYHKYCTKHKNIEYAFIV